MILSSLNRFWRLLATGLGFVIFGVFGLLFSLVLLPLAINHRRNSLKQQLLARRMNAFVWRLFVRYLTAFGILELNFVGKEKLGRPGQLILANHPSLLDVVFIVAHVPGINCVVKNDLLKNPVMRAAILSCGFILNDDPLRLIDEADEVLQQQCLLIFPEGTRTGWDGKINLNRGAISIGLRSAAVITPVVIKMAPANFKKGQSWYKIPKEKVQYSIVVADDIAPQKYLKERSLSMAARTLNTHLTDYFQKETK